MTIHHPDGARTEPRTGRPPTLRHAVTAVLTRLEGQLAPHGWDQPPALLGIFHRPRLQQARPGTSPILRPCAVDVPMGRMVEVDTTLVTAQTWHRPDPAAPAVNLHPLDVLLGLPDELTAPAVRPWLREWLHREGRRLVGFGLCFEGWQRGIRPGDLTAGLAADPSGQRTEVRVIAALDSHGHTWELIRRRGAIAPEINTGDRTGRRIAANGVLTALHRLNQLAEGH
ncbi:hypothetical protein OHA72_10425 [Dactylosporangium sp. NBC_01737]|uniref:hypothetical protein n=1 Tax=Dactylosporangium sp. NBC_01737 TaxID=2975959 RepID=UPI002E151FB3|nr:hypothetical protein OHA72_10425 [Dactylosporangium sp. NBC_01737]